MQENVRDPLVERLLGSGKPFELEDAVVFGRTVQVFKGAPRTVNDIYRKALTFRGTGRRLVVQDEVSYSYEDGFARAAALSRALREQYGVKRGTMVAMVMSNRPEWLISLIAIHAAGAVAVIVNSRGAAEEMLRAARQCDSVLVIADADRDAVMSRAEPDPAWPRIIIESERASLRPGKDASFEALSTPVAGLELDLADVSPEDGAVVLFTSGTTGFPKGALLGHGGVAQSIAIAGFMGALQDQRFEDERGRAIPPERQSMTSPVVILGPMFHLGGIMPTLRALQFGATVFIMTKWNVDIAFDMIEREGLSRLAFVPTMLWDMLRSPRAGPQNLGSVLYLSSGAALLNPALVDEIRARMPDCLLSNSYGQTEDSAWCASISGKAYFADTASCGWVVPSVVAEIRRDDGSLAPTGEAGEIFVFGANVMIGYYGDAKATAETIQDRWLATGDIGVFDETGKLTIVDRKKNMVISGGENIYCAEIERVLSDHEGVREVIAYGEPDARLGERLVVTVYAEPGAALGEEALKSYCKARLAIYKVPRAVYLTAEPLPRTATGKHDRGYFMRRAREKA